MPATKNRYKTNLVSLHTLCETNYVRLLRLFPEYEATNQRHLLVDNIGVSLIVTERSRFTTFFSLTQSQSSQWLGAMRVDLRCYHDVRMLEVDTFQSHRRVSARYQYPNTGMYQPDEKYQQNRFLADWLTWCLNNGRNRDVLSVSKDLAP